MKYDDLVVGDLNLPVDSSRWLADAVAAASSRDINAALRDARQLVHLIEDRHAEVQQPITRLRFVSVLREFALRGYGNCLERDGSASFKDIMDNLRNATAIGLFAYAYQLVVKLYLTVVPAWLLGIIVGTAFVVALAMLVVATFQCYWMCDTIARKIFGDKEVAVSWSEWMLRFLSILIFAPLICTIVAGVGFGTFTAAFNK